MIHWALHSGRVAVLRIDWLEKTLEAQHSSVILLRDSLVQELEWARDGVEFVVEKRL